MSSNVSYQHKIDELENEIAKMQLSYESPDDEIESPQTTGINLMKNRRGNRAASFAENPFKHDSRTRQIFEDKSANRDVIRRNMTNSGGGPVI